MERLLRRQPVVFLVAVSLWISADRGEAQSLRVDKGPSVVAFAVGERPVLEYRYADVVFKPYVAQLYTPAGVAVLRDSPADHKHHHALMFALGADGVDFWSEQETCGRQVHRRMDGPTVSTDGEGEIASVTHDLDWMAPDGRPVLQERRTLTLHHRPDVAATLLSWRSRLTAPPGKESIALTGAHYFGLGMRFVTSMDAVGTLVNSSGHPGELIRGDEHIVAARWSAYTATAGDKAVTVAMFDHPTNPRHPAKMFTMKQHFAYLSATLNLWREPLSLDAGRPLVLTYGIALWDGLADTERIEATYQQWLRSSECRN